MTGKKIMAGFLAVLTVLLLSSCQTTKSPEENASKTEPQEESEKQAVRVTVVQGPQAIGAVSLMRKAKLGRSRETYDFALTRSVEEASERLKKGQADLLLLPAVNAASLYQQSPQSVQICAVTALAPVQLLVKEAKIDGPEDLKDKKILLIGKDSTPQYLLEYVMQQAELAKEDVTLGSSASLQEASDLLAEGTYDAVLLPGIYADRLIRADETVHVALNCSEIWAKGHRNKMPVTGCAVVSAAFAAEQPDRLRLFLKEYAESAAFANSQQEETLGLSVGFGLLSAKTEARALSDSGITCVVGSAMKEMTADFFAAMKKVNPAAVGGDLPKEEFYWISLS